MGELFADDPQTVGGYTISGRLGENTSGVLYLAARDGQTVALRLMSTPVDSAAGAQFLQAAQLATFVTGANVARVLEAGLMDDRPYVVSEFVPAQPREESGPLSREELEKLANGTLSALSGIHKAGLIHGALHPGNVLVGADGVKVTDFGQITAQPAEGFMAPEQTAGQWLWASADMFSWAATMVYAATGATPDERGAAQSLRRIPMPLRDLLAACLAKDPDSRPTADEALRALASGTAPARPVEPSSVPVKRGKLKVLVIAGFLGLLIAVPTYALTGLAKPSSGPGPDVATAPAASSPAYAEPVPLPSESAEVSQPPVVIATPSVAPTSQRPSVKPPVKTTAPAPPPPPGIGCASHSKDYPIDRGGATSGKVSIKSITVCHDKFFGTTQVSDFMPDDWEVCVQINGHIAGTSSGNDGTYVGTRFYSSKVDGNQTFSISPGSGRRFDFVYVNLGNCQTSGTVVWDYRYSDTLRAAS